MLSMGITLKPADFVAVASEPSSILMQFGLCYGMMPALALCLGRAFGLDPGLLAGMVLVGSINGGQASNLCTYIARGNVALSVLMTTATTVGAILMTPFLCKAMLGTVVPVDAAGIAASTCQVSSFACVLFARGEGGRLGEGGGWDVGVAVHLSPTPPRPIRLVEILAPGRTCPRRDPAFLTP
jgi:hypothetical protein